MDALRLHLVTLAMILRKGRLLTCGVFSEHRRTQLLSSGRGWSARTIGLTSTGSAARCTTC